MSKMSTVYIGADHRGFELKNQLVSWLKEQGKQVEDLGNSIADSEDDYPEFAGMVAEKISEDPDSKGIVICGSGIGVDMVANKYDGVRSGLGLSTEQIEEARSADDINVLALAADFIDFDAACEMVNMFLDTDYKGEERFERRLDQVTQIEEEH
jgi:ribose 5-phosphate isomerase B